ncbi:MAG TPA: hypothetical protein VHT91_23890 [Kofleriaceae bacterium]|jgi:hypothetical protein|nr:hypothetical protein [Kofleriaceae bacterium]
MFRFATAIALVAASSSLASAQSASALAEALFRQGRELMAAGKTADACNAFAESQKLDPAISTLLNVASCREKLGQFATAWGLFVDAARQTRSASDAATRQLHTVAAERASKLESRISKLTINVPQGSQVDGLEVLRDKERIDAPMWNRALPIDGGSYTITARAPGTTTWTTQITVAPEGDTRAVDIPELHALQRDMVQAQPTATGVAVRARPAPAPAASPSRVAPIAVSVGAVALLGGGLGFGVSAASTYNDAKAETTSQSRRDSLENSANGRRHVAMGLAVAGVAAAGVAVWLWVRHHGESSMAATTARHVVVSPAGIAVVGGF